LAFLYFLLRVPAYKCSTPLGSLHGFIHCLNFKIRACGMYAYSISMICAPPCWTCFSHTKSMLLKGDFFEFWISLYWDFEAWPTFETMFSSNCTRKKNWYWCPKLYIHNMLNYMLIIIFNINANVHVFKYLICIPHLNLIQLCT